jgi:sugar/nucleoside kinase (ribokinase family)
MPRSHPTASRSSDDFDIVGLGALNIDFLVEAGEDVRRIDDLEKGAEYHERDVAVLDRSLDNLRRAGREICVQLGGSSLNTLRALAEIDADLRLGFVSVAGGTEESLPAGAGLETLPPHLDRDIEWVGGRHGACISLLEGDARTLITYNNQDAAARLNDATTQARLAQYIARSRVLHVTSIFGDEAPGAVASIIRRARQLKADLVVSVDPGLVWSSARGASAAVLAEADVLFVNEAELRRLSSTVSGDSERIRERARVSDVLAHLSPRAGRVVVLKRTSSRSREDYVGTAGAALYYETAGELIGQEFIREALPPDRIADSTGAGDVFAAGVLASMYSPRVEATRTLRLGFSAARYKLQRKGLDGYRGLEAVVRGRALPSGQGKVFISHSSKDRLLIEALEAFLGAGSPLQPMEQFFRSSVARQNARPSWALRRAIWEQLRAAEFALFLVTESFMASRDCAFECGAAAALGIPSIPLLGEGKRFDVGHIPVADRIGGRLMDPDALTAVHAELAEAYHYDPVDHRDFQRRLSAVVRAADGA